MKLVFEKITSIPVLQYQINELLVAEILSLCTYQR